MVHIIQTNGQNPFPRLEISDRYNPWSKLNIDQKPWYFTRYKLLDLRDEFQECTAILDEAGIEYRSLPDQTISSCELENRVVLDKSKYPYSAPVAPTCQMAAALAMWEKQVVAEAAEKFLKTAIKRIQHVGVFSCRNIAGSKRRSQHAHANAIDIKGFELANGKTITLLKDWGKNTAAGQFLAEIRNGSCGVFRGVLGPDYNKAHADHFHLDLGPYHICS